MGQSVDVVSDSSLLAVLDDTAEDEGLEPSVGCPSHALQACVPGFKSEFKATGFHFKLGRHQEDCFACLPLPPVIRRFRVVIELRFVRVFNKDWQLIKGRLFLGTLNGPEIFFVLTRAQEFDQQTAPYSGLHLLHDVHQAPHTRL